MTGVTGTDIWIAWNPLTAHGDWMMANGDLACGAGRALESAVLLSLFTDRIAEPDFKPNDGTTDRRGWWGDSYESSPIGSRYWQFERAKKASANAVLLQARDFGMEALQWLLDDGVASTITVSPRWVAPSVLGILVRIQEPNGVNSVFNYAWAWNGMTT